MNLMLINSAVVRMIESEGADTEAGAQIIAAFAGRKVAGKYRRERRKARRLENVWLDDAVVRVGQFNLWRQHEGVIAIQHVSRVDLTSVAIEYAPMYQLGFTERHTISYFGRITHRTVLCFSLLGLTFTIASRHIELFTGRTRDTYRGRVLNWRH
jgi:hypothetical protein